MASDTAQCEGSGLSPEYQGWGWGDCHQSMCMYEFIARSFIWKKLSYFRSGLFVDICFNVRNTKADPKAKVAEFILKAVSNDGPV